MRFFFLLVYYIVVKHLPSNSSCKLCVYLRRIVVSFIFSYVGKNVNIASNVRFGKGNNLSIGNNSGIGEDSYIVCMDKVFIGDDVMIGPQVMILTGGHGYKDENLLLRKQKIITKPVSIGNDCWVGSRAIILPGVTICDRVVIGAGSVVSKSIETSGVYAGNPAKKIREL
ncbi:acyltransferase [Vibrio vulnificus]|uniref:acyltransferase n=1 Tax=Vibrio vulnificus TaxID=672 RepID=UPI001A27BC90|nr:acyltransferase [Vibrio vulnificus]EGR0111096.1 acyltransferase [Vibrio vulnificus]EIF5015766.1 acyltransferase [Vibrio vulnificus]EIO2321773.1 acyltransferase [Vibrio vulnificus]EIO4067716.1 acyltransferase [Vibrio vulnificus]EJO9867911.1 acyltransferase [Vibrio vulnificus]